MFADSLLDSHWANRSHRGWTTLASFALQALGVGILLVLPLIFTEGLPQLQWIAAIVAPTPPPAPPPPRDRIRAPTGAHSNLSGTHILEITQIPKGIHPLSETEPPPAIDPLGLGVPGGTGDPRALGNVFGSTGMGNILPPPPPPSAPPARVSRMMEGNLVYKVQPEYPPMARSARIQGGVVLRAIISRTGTIEHVKLLRGHPLLVKAAIDAVSQWRYRPYILNGDPVEVETEVTVNFVLSGG
jgi:periplasmic protein TonB